MRVAYVCADRGVPVFGHKGCSVHVQEVIRALTGRGARVEVFARRCEGEPPPGLEPIRLHRLPALPKADPTVREQAALAANHGTRELLERQGAFDLVYERYSLWSFAGMEYAWDRGIPGLLEVNAPLIDEQAEYRTLVDRASAEWVAERAFTAAAAVLAVSDTVATYVESFPAARGRVHVVPNGVNPGRFRPGLAPALASEPGTLTIGFAGSLKPWHGLATLAEAFARLRRGDVRLLIVGDGPGRVELEADLAARGLRSAAHFAGAVPPGDVPSWLVSMDVAVAPYPPLERFYFSPLKVYEYLATGLPVVVSRVGQVEDVIRHEVSGLLVPPGDAAALAAAIERLRLDPGLRARLGQAARATVLRGHTWEAVVERVLRLAGLGPATPVSGTTSPNGLDL
jgi:glycosyltransferase involved in cell wall biosynthesis